MAATALRVVLGEELAIMCNGIDERQDPEALRLEVQARLMRSVLSIVGQSRNELISACGDSGSAVEAFEHALSDCWFVAHHPMYSGRERGILALTDEGKRLQLLMQRLSADATQLAELQRRQEHVEACIEREKNVLQTFGVNGAGAIFRAIDRAHDADDGELVEKLQAILHDATQLGRINEAGTLIAPMVAAAEAGDDTQLAKLRSLVSDVTQLGAMGSTGTLITSMVAAAEAGDDAWLTAARRFLGHTEALAVIREAARGGGLCCNVSSFFNVLTMDPLLLSRVEPLMPLFTLALNSCSSLLDIVASRHEPALQALEKGLRTVNAASNRSAKSIAANGAVDAAHAILASDGLEPGESASQAKKRQKKEDQQRTEQVLWEAHDALVLRLKSYAAAHGLSSTELFAALKHCFPDRSDFRNRFVDNLRGYSCTSKAGKARDAAVKSFLDKQEVVTTVAVVMSHAVPAGQTRTFTTPDGRAVSVSFPAGAQAGQRLQFQCRRWR